MMPIALSSMRYLLLGSMVLLAACSSTPQSGPVASSGSVSSSTGGARPLHDGPPSYMQDVSLIPDAIPTPHTGAYKASPYTVLGQRYHPMQDGRSYREEGTASWYGTKFHGQNTANGELYDLYGMSAAHKTLPLPTYVKVTNLENGRQVIVRVNDRGPFYSDRIIDLSFAAAKKLGYADQGTARVRVEGIDPVAWQQQNNPSYLVTREAVSTAPVMAALPPEPVENVRAGGYYLQVGAFSSDQAAQALRQRVMGVVGSNVLVSPVQIDSRTLHRVRVGPLNTQDEARRMMETLRVANLGTPALVTAN
ncbi:MAG: septal ring lytic transglycosylase RlpA family protein [Pseudomonadaceae bacterium]